jgi:hypothetical protein
MHPETPVDLRIKHLRKLASLFRAGIERADRSRLPIGFSDFPRGSCGDATLLLGTFLLEEGLPEFQYMLGERHYDGSGFPHSHAWLQREKLIIDITADKFPDKRARVIVSRQSKWHEAFEARAEHVADYRIYDSATVSSLAAAYAEFERCLGAT